MDNYFNLYNRGAWLNTKDEIDNFFSADYRQIAPFVTTYKVDFLPLKYLSGIKWLNANGLSFNVIGWDNVTNKLYLGCINKDNLSATWREL